MTERLPDAAPVALASDAADRLREAVAASGVRRVLVLGWRDLSDDEAGGSELHLHEIARRWADAGVELTVRTSSARSRPATERRGGYDVRRAGGRMSVFRAVGRYALTERLGPTRADALVEIWNGVPWFGPRWFPRPHVVWLHHVHGPMDPDPRSDAQGDRRALGVSLGAAVVSFRSDRHPRRGRRGRLIDDLRFSPTGSPSSAERPLPRTSGQSGVPLVLAVGLLVQ
ncbi:MAG: hypothetical protein R2705_22475 [Ilumatobacteraceae bacterium]